MDELLAEAAARIQRLEPVAVFEAVRAGATLVDLRSDGARERDGLVSGSLHVPRTVLEWRLDPESPWRSPHAPSLEERVILLCDHGFSSALAAAILVELGFTRVGDVVGGFAAWLEAGLPVAEAAAPRPERGEIAGMRGPDP